MSDERLVSNLKWQQQYEESINLAVRAIENNLPTFVCLVDKKYKQTIWNEALKRISAKKNQLELEYGYESL